VSAGYMRRCAGKDRHENREVAGAARKKLSASTKLPISQFSIYRCEQCMGWHVGRAGHTFQTRTRRPGKRAGKKMRGRL
jgi:hypothetical protein